MSKKSLRSVLAVAFSAGLVSVALGALSPAVAGTDSTVAVQSQGRPPADLAWDAAPAKLAEASTAAERGPDMGWDSAPTAWDAAPAKLAEASTAAEHGPDMGWDFAPTEKDRA